MEHSSLCALCLKGVEIGKQRQPHSSLSTLSPRPPSTHDVGSLCKLLMPPVRELESSSSLIHERKDGNNCSLCSTCAELIQEMGQIREQISQLQNQIGKRIVLVRNMILDSDVKRLEKILHCEVDEMEKLREIREILLRLSVPDDNFVTTDEVEVKLEPEDVDFFEDDTLSQLPSSPSSFLLHPDEDGLGFKHEDGGGDSDNSFSINPQKKKPNLRRSGRRKEKETVLPNNKKLSSSEPEMKFKRNMTSPPKKKRRLIKHSSPPISDNDAGLSSDDPADDPEFDPLPMSENKVKIKKSQKSKSLKKFTENLPLKCDHCSTRFSTQDALSNHIQQWHFYKCKFCDSSFRTILKLQIHHKAQHSSIPFAQCKICKKRFRMSQQHLDEHMVIHHETEDKAFFCDKCNKGFTLEVNYKRHLELHKVEDVKPLVCEICDSRFSKQFILDQHFATHSKLIDKCDICSQVFWNSAGLTRHMRTHTGEKPYQCDHCGEKFIDHSAKRWHIAKVHSTPDQHHLCTVCGRTFFDLNILKVHLTRHDGTSMLSCDQCGEKFREKSTLETHKVDKHGADPFVCDQCGATLKSAHSLARHKKNHTAEKPYKCDVCDVRFVKKHVLEDHVRRHTGERPFACSECELTFISKKNLANHVKINHTPDYIIPILRACSYPGCTKRFQYKSSLDKHFLQVHTTERPFVCEICNKGFSTSSFLTLHKKAAHGIQPQGIRSGLPKSKRPSNNSGNTGGRRIKKRISNPNPTSSSSDSDSNSEPPPTQFDLQGHANINGNSNIPPVLSFHNPSYFSNYYHL